MRLENSRGRMSVAPPLAEKSSVPLNVGNEKYVTVLASEVSDLKARLADAERRASIAGILPQPSTSSDQRTHSTYRATVPLNLLASLRVRQDEDNGEVAARPSFLHNVRSQSTSCKHGRCMRRCCEIRLRTACVIYFTMLHHTQSVPLLDVTSA